MVLYPVARYAPNGHPLDQTAVQIVRWTPADRPDRCPYASGFSSERVTRQFRRWSSAGDSLNLDPVLFTLQGPLKADIRVGSGHPVFRDRPWTQQSQECRQTGDYISVPSSYLTDNSNVTRRGWFLMRQWARYRYGIFDDTSCIDEENIKHEFCTNGTARHVTSKHQFLCETAAYDVVLNHRDVVENVYVAQTVPKFTYKVTTWPKLLFAFDDYIQDIDWNVVRVAFRKMLDYVPKSKVTIGLLGYHDNSVRVYQNPDVLTSSTIDDVADAPCRNVTEQPANMFHLTKAINLLGHTEGKGVIIVASNCTSVDESVIDSAVQLASKKKLRVSVIAFGLTSDEAKYNLATLAAKTNGHFVDVPSIAASDVLTALIRLEDAFVSAVKFHAGNLASSMPVTILSRRLPRTSDRLEFVIDHADQYSEFSIYQDPIQGAIEGAKIDSADVYCSLAEADADKVYSNTSTPWVYTWPKKDANTCFPQAGNWTFSCQRESTRSIHARIVSHSTSVPTADLKIRYDRSALVFRATVQLNNLPVHDALVKLTIRPVDGSCQPVDVHLVDDGRIQFVSTDNGKVPTEMDVNKDDGVYTKVVNYTSGPATVHLTVADGNGRAYAMSPNFVAESGTTWDTLNVPRHFRRSLRPFNITITKALTSSSSCSSSASTASGNRRDGHRMNGKIVSVGFMPGFSKVLIISLIILLVVVLLTSAVVLNLIFKRFSVFFIAKTKGVAWDCCKSSRALQVSMNH